MRADVCSIVNMNKSQNAIDSSPSLVTTAHLNAGNALNFCTCMKLGMHIDPLHVNCILGFGYFSSSKVGTPTPQGLTDLIKLLA